MDEQNRNVENQLRGKVNIVQQFYGLTDCQWAARGRRHMTSICNLQVVDHGFPAHIRLIKI